MKLFACCALLLLATAIHAGAEFLADGPGLDAPEKYQLEPEPMDPAKLPPPPSEPPAADPAKPADKPEEQPRLSPVDPRPELTICVSSGCQPCIFLEREIKAGKLDAFQVRIVRYADGECPGIYYFPAAIFTDARGRRWVMPQQDGDPPRRPAPTAATILAKWQELNPDRPLSQPAPAPADPATSSSAAKTLVDQLANYLGSAGTIVIQPARPIVAVMEDGSKVSYSRLSARYQITDGVPALQFDPPAPRVDARKFGLHFGATISDARLEPPATLAIGTSRGRYRIRLEAAE